MAGRSVDALVASEFRRAGLPARWMPETKAVFPQPRRASRSTGTSFAVSRSLHPVESLVAQALPGAHEEIVVGRSEPGPRGVFRCTVRGKRLLAEVDPGGTVLSCLPPAKFLKAGAKVPAWWFSAYEELGGGTAWHDGLDDNGTYYWTVDLLKSTGKGVRVVPMGFSRDGSGDFGDTPSREAFRALLQSSGLLEDGGLVVYWTLLPCDVGRSPAVASLHLPMPPGELATCAREVAETLGRARTVFDRSAQFRAFWKIRARDRVILY